MSSVDEKHEAALSHSTDDCGGDGGLDASWHFLDRHRDANVQVDMKTLRRKIDWHIVPFMFACYTMQFLDKVMINYGAIMGLTTQLHLKGSEFSNVSAFMFVALLCFEVPNTLFLQMLPAAKWLGINVTLWGVAAACGAATHDYRTLLGSRVALGIFESTIGPSLLLISSQWYTKSEQAPRFSFWYMGLGLGQIIGGLLSFGFQHIKPNTALAGWRIMFVALGGMTVLTGLATALFVPDTPMAAKWLTNGEKVALLKHVSVNQTGIKNNRFRPKEILEAFLDPQMYLMVISVMCLSVSSGVITIYSSTLITNLGYTPKRAALMNTPSGLVSLFFTLLIGLGIRRVSHRWAWSIACIVPGILGGALMSFLPTTNHSGILAGIYLVNAVTAPLTVFYAWTSANFAGSTKRAFAAAMVSGSLGVGNIIGPQTFQARDAPDYRPAKLAVMGTLAGCALSTFALFAYYVWENRRRGTKTEQSEEAYLAPEVWADMTDRENRNFRYTY